MTSAPTTATMEVYESAQGPRAHVAGLVPMFASGAPQLPSVYLLRDSAPSVIGREDGVEVALSVSAVSRKHASISKDSEGWRIHDLGSRNGLLVDGTFVTSEKLEHGAEIRTGDIVFKFVEWGANLYQGYRYDGSMEPGACRQAHEATMLLGGAQVDHIVGSLEKIAQAPLSVILQGESGTGKEVAASEVHRLSGRRGAFVPVNCAAIPAQLLESELFGYRKGAFSGADRDKIGLVKAANGGTLFLDEIGDMPLEAQSKLLRVLQSREVTPVGATVAEPVDVRIICATHRDLAAAQARGTFRGDLYARLNEYSVSLPALRDRKEDMFLLTRALLARHGRRDLGVSFPFMVGLLHYDWPFNVRELEACVKRAVALVDGPTLDAPHLPDSLRDAMESYGARGPIQSPSYGGSGQHHAVRAPSTPPPPGVVAAVRGAPTEAELRALLVAHHGNVAAVGRVFGKERMQIHRWMKRYGIDVAEFRGS